MLNFGRMEGKVNAVLYLYDPLRFGLGKHCPILGHIMSRGVGV